MAKKPDTPCAGGCGKLLWSGRTSLPAGERTCQPCRRRERTDHDGTRRHRGPERPCSTCGKPFIVYKASMKACSPGCGQKARRPRELWQETRRACAGGCDGTVVAPRMYCHGCAAVRRLANWQRKNLKRRAGGEPMSIAEMGERDRWRCHLCRRRVSPEARYPSPWSASRDHLVPVAHGGTNDPSNLALAHLRCNVRRGTRGVVQLQLVG